MSTRIEAINLLDRLAVTETGEVISITDMFDDCGEWTEELDEVAAAVAGPSVNGLWFSIDATKYSSESTH